MSFSPLLVLHGIYHWTFFQGKNASGSLARGSHPQAPNATFSLNFQHIHLSSLKPLWKLRVSQDCFSVGPMYGSLALQCSYNRPLPVNCMRWLALCCCDHVYHYHHMGVFLNGGPHPKKTIKQELVFLRCSCPPPPAMGVAVLWALVFLTLQLPTTFPASTKLVQIH